MKPQQNISVGVCTAAVDTFKMGRCINFLWFWNQFSQIFVAGFHGRLFCERYVAVLMYRFCCDFCVSRLFCILWILLIIYYLHGFRDELNRQQEAENAFRKDIRGQISFSMQSELFPSFERRSSREDLNIASEEAFPAVGTEVAPSLPVTTLSEPPTPSTSASKSFAQVTLTFE